MKIIGVIAEFNPFHNGHARLLSFAKDILGADYVLAVMSGSFVQRGEPACQSRRVRANEALAAGFDAVISLPVGISTASAEGFAEGGVRALTALCCVDTLLFGSESGDLARLESCAKALLSETSDRSEILKDAQKSGLSYPKARALAFPEYADLLEQPNNILAIEYLKAIQRLGSPLLPRTLRREGSYHESTSKEAPSARTIRHLAEAWQSRKETPKKSIIADAGEDEISPQLACSRTVDDSSPQRTRSRTVDDSSPQLAYSRTMGDSSPQHTSSRKMGDPSPQLAYSRTVGDSSPQHAHSRTMDDSSPQPPYSRAENQEESDIFSRKSSPAPAKLPDDVSALALLARETMPPASADVFLDGLKANPLVTPDDFSLLLAASLFKALSYKDYLAFAGVTEELARRIFEKRDQCTSFRAFAETIRTKNTTLTAVSRALLSILLEIPKGAERSLPYLRLLGYRKEAQPLLREIAARSEIPVLYRIAEAEALPFEEQKAHLRREIASQNLYELVRARKAGRPPRTDLTQPILRI